MMQGIGDLLSGLRTILPGWAFALLLTGLAIVIVPAWIRSVRSKQIRGAVRRMVRAEGGERVRLHQRVMGIASGRGPLLVVAATEAQKRGLLELYREANDALIECGGHAEDVKRLQDVTAREEKPTHHPLEEAVIIERLIDEGMHEIAAQRIDAGLRRFRDDPDLLAARDHLEKVRTKQVGSGPLAT